MNRPRSAGDALSVPPIGTATEFGGRLYDDGFVNMDGSTAANGGTWFWGYNSPSQVSGDLPRFRATGFRSEYFESSDYSGPFSSDDDLRSLSPQIDFVFRPPSDSRLPFDGFLVSFWFFNDDSSHRFTDFSARRTRNDFRLDYTDRYDISILQPVIGAPYEGSIGRPGPLLGNRPVDRERLDVLVGGDTADFENSISTSLDLDAYSLALGPTLSGRFRENWSWQASAGVTLNVFRWSARETERLGVSLTGGPSTNFQEWRDHNSGTDFRLGVYLKGDLIRDLSENWFIKGSLQAEMAGTVEMKIGDSGYEFKPRGYAIGLALGHVF